MSRAKNIVTTRPAETAGLSAAIVLFASRYFLDGVLDWRPLAVAAVVAIVTFFVSRSSRLATIKKVNELVEDLKTIGLQADESGVVVIEKDSDPVDDDQRDALQG